MTNTQALQAVKDLIAYCEKNTISEIQTEEYDAPLVGEGVKMKRYKKVEYLIRTIETVVSPDMIDKQVESIDTQIVDLTTQKNEIVSIGEQIKTIQDSINSVQ